LPWAYGVRQAGGDHKEGLHGIFAHNPAADRAQARHSCATSLWKGESLGRKEICKAFEDRRQYCSKVMSNEPFAEKEVDSVIHFDRAS
jgi:hypothetical protein